jgi:glycosyltransferase involved in cell wall biosynthesis
VTSPEIPDDLSVSVVVPVLNGMATIEDLLTALTRQGRAPRDTEILVVDNGSTDETRALVRRFPVVLLEETKPGPGAARNCGLRAAHGAIIAYLDADTLPTRYWLAELVVPFADPRVLLVGGATLSYCPETGAQRYMAQAGAFKLEYQLARGVFPFVASRNMAVRRQAALRIGGWAENMPTAEDMDFCFRLLREFRSTIYHQPRALLFHRDRKTDQELWRQAWSFGEGLADMYLRYPDVACWNRHNAVWVVRQLLVRCLRRVFFYLAHRAGFVSAARAEFADYHWRWSIHYWQGFWKMYRTKERRRT